MDTQVVTVHKWFMHYPQLLCLFCFFLFFFSCKLTSTANNLSGQLWFMCFDDPHWEADPVFENRCSRHSGSTGGGVKRNAPPSTPAPAMSATGQLVFSWYPTPALWSKSNSAFWFHFPSVITFFDQKNKVFRRSLQLRLTRKKKKKSSQTLQFLFNRYFSGQLLERILLLR